MSEPDTSPVPKRRAPWRALRWLPGSHGEVWLAATSVWLVVAMLNAVLGWPMLRTLAPAVLLAVIGAAESLRLRRRASAAPARD
jgi:ABC-type branched-subunit amino acid transport system permease subunit